MLRYFVHVFGLFVGGIIFPSLHFRGEHVTMQHVDLSWSKYCGGYQDNCDSIVCSVCAYQLEKNSQFYVIWSEYVSANF